MSTTDQHEDALPPLGKTHKTQYRPDAGRIQIDNVTVDFGNGALAVSDASLEIEPGEFVCLDRKSVV